MAERNAIFNRIWRNLREKHGIENEDEAKSLAKKSIAENRRFVSAGGQKGKTKQVQLIDDQCLGIIPNCDIRTPFRTINGQCNNLGQPFLGAMSTPFLRFIDVDEYNPKLDFDIYLDLLENNDESSEEGGNGGKGGKGGKGAKGKGGKGGRGDLQEKYIGGNGNCARGNQKYGCPRRKELPSARTVSHNFHTDADLPSAEFTHMVAQVGQYLDHDITLTPETEAEHCCSNGTQQSDDCFPILVSENDAFYGPRDVSCLEFSRSVSYCEENGEPRTQVNVITSFVDASNVYSSDDETAKKLRSFVDGKLKTGPYNLLPIIEDSENEEGVKETAGDNNYDLSKVTKPQRWARKVASI